MSLKKTLKENKSISENVTLLFDEMYLQKCKEYVDCEMVETDEDGELYKGVVCFMIIALKSNIPDIISTVPGKEIRGKWHKDKLLRCMQALQNISFNFRGVVCDDHSTNVSAYKKFLAEYSDSPVELYIRLNEKKIYLLFGTVHLIKNIRNNLLTRKRFPFFNFNDLYDNAYVAGWEISWHLFHKVLVIASKVFPLPLRFSFHQHLLRPRIIFLDR